MTCASRELLQLEAGHATFLPSVRTALCLAQATAHVHSGARSIRGAAYGRFAAWFEHVTAFTAAVTMPTSGESGASQQISILCKATKQSSVTRNLNHSKNHAARLRALTPCTSPPGSCSCDGVRRPTPMLWPNASPNEFTTRPGSPASRTSTGTP